MLEQGRGEVVERGWWICGRLAPMRCTGRRLGVIKGHIALFCCFLRGLGRE